METPEVPPAVPELKFILEAALFHAQKPLTVEELRELLAAAAQSEEPETKAWKKVRTDDARQALEALAAELEKTGRSFRLVCVAGAWQFVTQPVYAPWLRSLLGQKPRLPRLSQPALETLAIIAYRQPVTRAEMEQIRGVSVDGVLQTLLERGLVEPVGRAEAIGRPVTFGTTAAFLEYFGLRDLEGLPAADELRRAPAVRPESLATAEPGLATAPPEDLQDASGVSGPPPAGSAAADGPPPASGQPLPGAPRDRGQGEEPPLDSEVPGGGPDPGNPPRESEP